MPLYPPPFGLGSVQNQYPPQQGAATTVVSASGNTVINPGGVAAAYLTGITNTSASAQTATYTFYDNATTNSGTVVYTCATPGPGQTIIFPGPGIPLANGCVCNASGVAVGGGIEVQTR